MVNHGNRLAGAGEVGGAVGRTFTGLTRLKKATGGAPAAFSNFLLRRPMFFITKSLSKSRQQAGRTDF